MNENTKETIDAYVKPSTAMKSDLLNIGGTRLEYTAKADWIILRKDEEPTAEMFYVSYSVDSEGQRPLTFVFNGGPGASSVYLHLGALGPRRIESLENGQPGPPPYPLVDNPESWLQFTDLVFIDPVGTGFSRMIKKKAVEGKEEKPAEKKKESEYWQVKRDLESLGEFIRRYLSTNHRWESKIYIAGESYGGFRAAKLAKIVQQDYGVPLSGTIIISPAMEFTLLDGSDYDVLMWIDVFPTMAVIAKEHGKSRKHREGEASDTYRARAAEFAIKQLLPVLAVGDMYGEKSRVNVLNQAADFIGIPRDVMKVKNGRVTIEYFVKNLLREERLHLGLYDGCLTVTDPYPGKENWEGPDPTLHQLERVFSAGINTQLRKNIGLDTDREYDLISLDVNKSWKVDTKEHALDSQVGATDDLRYGMSLNPDMKVYLTHGIYDLVTPWFSSERITHLMNLTTAQKAQMTVKYYIGGHMFYTRKESRKEFFRDIREFYQR